MFVSSLSTSSNAGKSKGALPIGVPLLWRFVGVTVFVVLPILLLVFGMQTEYGASSRDKEVNLSGSLRFRSLWLYGATHDALGEDWHPMLAQMQSIRATLRTRHPQEVAATDAAWNRFSSSLEQTGHVDWRTANQMRVAANNLTDAIERNARQGHHIAFWLYLSGIITTGVSAILTLYFLLHNTKTLQARYAADERFRVLFEYSSDAHLLFDETGIIDCNPVTIQMLRCSDKAEVLALHPAVLSPQFQPDGQRSLEKSVEMDRLARENGYHRFEWIHRKMDGTDFPVEVTLTPVALNGRDCLLVVWHDLTLRKQAEEQLRLLAITDGLTGLKNHRVFQEKLVEEFELLQRYQNPISIILLDVDKFKSYNDTFGHPEGDTVLKTVARILQQMARQTDYVCRYGGEEFVIILPSTDASAAVDVAERFRAAIEQYPWVQRSITASFGVSTWHTHLTSAQELINQADRALYASKEKGRNRVTHFAAIAAVDGLTDLQRHPEYGESVVRQNVEKSVL